MRNYLKGCRVSKLHFIIASLIITPEPQERLIRVFFSGPFCQDVTQVFKTKPFPFSGITQFLLTFLWQVLSVMRVSYPHNHLPPFSSGSFIIRVLCHPGPFSTGSFIIRAFDQQQKNTRNEERGNHTC